jgi:hypothetical protein
MKKIKIIIILFVLSTSAWGQRIVLVEEFTQASCNPCAVVNPIFEEFVHVNTFPLRKLVTIKYQTSWPGIDPMNTHNPIEVQSRVDYYNVAGVPHFLTDGMDVGKPSQNLIDSLYNQSIPFSIALEHSFSPNADSIYIELILTAQEPLNAIDLVGKIAVVEEEINFSVAPGTNGETSFFSVMKKILPDANGTVLQDIWMPGESLTILQTWPLSNIYNLNEIGVVAWVQNNADKKVLCANYSAPIILQGLVDVALTKGNIPEYQCSSPLSPLLHLSNNGAADLSSCTFRYRIDNNPDTLVFWEGMVASGSAVPVSLPPIFNLTNGPHTLTISVENTNLIDASTLNNTIIIPFFFNDTTGVISTQEGFTDNIFPPEGWFSYDTDEKDAKWGRNIIGHNNSGSAKITNYGYAGNAINDLYLPMLDLSMANSPLMSFDVAHRMYAATIIDQLQVQVSTDCGMNWETVYDKAGNMLASVSAPLNLPFTPSNSQWRSDSIDLSSFIGNDQVLLRFRSIGGGGNNIYIDNIAFQVNTVSVDHPASDITPIAIHPNPANHFAHISIPPHSGTYDIVLYNTLGNNVLTKKIDSSIDISPVLNTTLLPSGPYRLAICKNNTIFFNQLLFIHH